MNCVDGNRNVVISIISCKNRWKTRLLINGEVRKEEFPYNCKKWSWYCNWWLECADWSTAALARSRQRSNSIRPRVTSWGIRSLQHCWFIHVPDLTLPAYNCAHDVTSTTSTCCTATTYSVTEWLPASSAVCFIRVRFCCKYRLLDVLPGTCYQLGLIKVW